MKMRLVDLLRRLEALRRETESLKVMAGFLPADDAFVQAGADKIELATIDLMQRIKQAERDLGK